MAELLLRGRGGKSWGLGLGAGGLPGAALQQKKLAGCRWRVVSPRVRGHDDDGQRKQQIPEKLCAGLAALLLLSPQNLTSLPFVGRLAFEPPQAKAAGLLTMPPQTLNNRYYLVRAGYSYFESSGVIHTNPVSKTSVDSGLSTEGVQQTERAAIELKTLGACEGSCWIWPSITQRSYQAAELIASVNRVNYSRIVPEYSFLDARGLGAYENQKLSAISEFSSAFQRKGVRCRAQNVTLIILASEEKLRDIFAGVLVYASDLESATRRPPKFTDGTPNESVSDVLVRVTQLMSILETQYFGDTIIIVSPDSDNLSVLQAAMSGQDIGRHSALAFAPGEVRRFDKDALPSRRPLISGKFKIKQ